MKHLTVGIALVAIVVLGLYYNIVEINFNLLQMYTGNIALWLLTLTLGGIISSQLRK